MYNVSLVPFDSFNGKPIFKYIYLPKLVLTKQFETQFARLHCLQKSSLNIIFKLFKIHYLSSRCLFFPQKAFRFIKYDGPDGPLFSSTISFFFLCSVFGYLKQFSESLNSSAICQVLLRSLKQSLWKSLNFLQTSYQKS